MLCHKRALARKAPLVYDRACHCQVPIQTYTSNKKYSHECRIKSSSVPILTTLNI